MDFEWDEEKNASNKDKHDLSFEDAQFAFSDPRRVIAVDHKHSTKKEQRFFCYGKVHGRIATVRFTLRENVIRIFGAGYWREGYAKYQKKNSV